MAAELISTIRMGQRQLSERLLVDLGVEKGLLSANDAQATLSAEITDLGSHLLDRGLLSTEQLRSLQEGVEMSTLMDTLQDTQVPDEVIDATADPQRRIGRYTLVREIGAGGMGVVWRGWDGQLSRWVAIKKLKVNDQKLVSRFMREASLLAQLTHPNITAVYEIGINQGQPFLVMELVDGGSPGGASLARREAAAIVRDAARAVAYAHKRGIIHRDLKPSNLLMDSGGRVFVTDFGLARMREDGTQLTVSGALLGTPSFMAPEQAMGREADHRTDVYGLGATLYALVAGKPPHSGEIVAEVVKRVAVANPPVLEGGDDLAIIAQKAMERDREDRYQDADELAEELQRYIDDEPIVARPLNSAQRLWRRSRRRPVLAGGIALGALLTVAALSIAGFQLREYYSRQAQIQAAGVYLANAEGQVDELRKLYSNEVIDPVIERATLDNLHREADRALEQAPGLAQAAYLKGLALLWEGDYPSAHEYMTTALDDDPSLGDARVYRIVTEFARSDAASPEIMQDRNGFRVVPSRNDAAREATIQAIREDLSALNPESDRIHLPRAILASVQGEFEEAIAELQEHRRRFLVDQRIRGLLNIALLGGGAIEEARSASLALIEQGKFPAAGYSGLAFSEAALGNTDAAIEAMRQSLSLLPDADNQQWVAYWQFETGELEDALTTYNEILAEEPDHVPALLGRAMILALVSTEPDAALIERQYADATRAVRLEPENAYAQFTLGQAAVYVDPQQAISAHRRAIELDPQEYRAHSSAMIASAYFQLADYAQAAATMREAVALEPEKENWRLNLARFELMAEDYAGVVATLAPLGEQPEALELVAMAQEYDGDLEAAMATAASLAEVDPGNEDHLIRKARYASMLGDRGQAEAALAQAQALAPDSADLAFYGADVWFRLGEAGRALGFSERYFSLRPPDADAWAQRAEILIAAGRPDKAVAASIEAVSAAPEELYYQLIAAESLAASGRQAQAGELLPLLLATDTAAADQSLLWCYLRDGEKARAVLETAGDVTPQPQVAELQQICPLPQGAD